MAELKDRTIYIGTNDGLYSGRSNGSGYEASPLAFQGQGSMRASVVPDIDNPDRLYAGTNRSGFFRSDDRGKSWTELNHGLTYKNVWSIAQHPVTKTLYLGTCPAGVFISNDRGETWAQCDQMDTLPTTAQWTGPVPPHVSRMKSIGLHRNDPNLIYGAIEEGWAVRSLDGGKTWEQMSEGMDHDGHTITLMPDDPNKVIATGGKGMYRSSDRGDSWTLSNEGIVNCRYTPADLVVHEATPNVLITAVSRLGPGMWRGPENPGVAFVRSEDQGSTWSMMTEGLPADYRGVPRALVGDRDDRDMYFAGMTDGAVWLSTDGAESFHQILGGLPGVLSIAVAPA